MLHSFNIIDFFLFVLLILYTWAGWSKGFTIGIIELVKWLGGLLIAFAGYQYTARLIDKVAPSLGAWLMPVSFLVTLIIAGVLLSWLARVFYRALPPKVHRTTLNKALGLLPGFLTGVVYVVLISALLLSFPLFDGLSTKARDSYIASRLSGKIEWLDSRVSPVFDEAVKKTMTKLTVEPGSNETVKLHYTVSNPKTREDLEGEMLQLVNEERQKAGLPALKADPEMTVVARAHSKDMFARGYFSHYTPEGKDPFDRMKAAGVHFIVAGENLALGQTLGICHTGLMNSPGHRENILRPSFGRVGIGILDGGMYGLMISQEFRN